MSRPMNSSAIMQHQNLFHFIFTTEKKANCTCEACLRCPTPPIFRGVGPRFRANEDGYPITISECNWIRDTFFISMATLKSIYEEVLSDNPEIDLWSTDAIRKMYVLAMQVAVGDLDGEMRESAAAIQAQERELRERIAAAPAPLTRKQKKAIKQKAKKSAAKRAVVEEEGSAGAGAGAGDAAAEDSTDDSTEDDDSERLCVICIEAHPGVMFNSCGHVCMCETCFAHTRIQACPVCRQKSTTRRVSECKCGSSEPEHRCTSCSAFACKKAGCACACSDDDRQRLFWV